MAVLLLIIGLILFVGLVVVHEFGHFIMARRNGVEIEEFGIGFPPTLWRKRIKSPKGDYDFTINLLPLGGFVKMKGEHDSDTEKGTFGAASLSGKVKIMVAGVVMNLVAAFVIFTIVALIGMPQLVANQFTVTSDAHVLQQTSTTVRLKDVQADSPAEKAGLRAGDVITAAGPLENSLQPVNSDIVLQNLSALYAGRSFIVQYSRDGKAGQTTVNLNSKQTVEDSQKTNKPTGYLGVLLSGEASGWNVQRFTWSAPIVAAGVMGQFTVLTFQGLGHALAGVGSIIAGAFTGNSTARTNGQTVASSQVSGPVGIFVTLKNGSALGYQFMLFIIAIISLSLAIMNILPIPALDGGRLWFTLVARALKRPLTAKAEEIINTVGFVTLMLLVVLITVVDVGRTRL